MSRKYTQISTHTNSAATFFAPPLFQIKKVNLVNQDIGKVFTDPQKLLQMKRLFCYCSASALRPVPHILRKAIICSGNFLQNYVSL